MVKTPIYNEPMKTVGIKLPQSKIDEVPDNMKNSTYFRQIIMGDIDSENVKSEIIYKLTTEQKSTAKSFYDLFIKLVLDGNIDEYITDDLITGAEKLKEMAL